MFRKLLNQQTIGAQTEVKPSGAEQVSVVAVAAATDQKLAVAVAVATTQADVEAARFNNHGRNRNRDEEQYAAIVIQTAFRGYLVSAVVCAAT